MHATDNTAKKEEHLKPSDAEDGVRGFGVCYAGFRSCFGPEFPLYNLISPFWDGSMVFCVLIC